MSTAGGGRRARGGTRGACARARSSDFDLRTVWAHEIGQRQRTFDRARVQPFREHVTLVGRRLLIDQLMQVFIGRSFVNYTDRDPLCPG